MRYETVNDVQWLVAEESDFLFQDGDQQFWIIEDENGDRFYAYGHVTLEDLLAELNRYTRHMSIMPDPDITPDGSGALEHVYAIVDEDGERWNWGGITIDTPHSWPLTVYTC